MTPPIPPPGRPWRWRLPLAGIGIAWLLGIRLVDRRLADDRLSDADAQATQMAGFLAHFVALRTALVDGVRQSLPSDDPERVRRRFPLLARQVGTAAPDLALLALLDSGGVIRAVYPPTAANRALVGTRRVELPLAGPRPDGRGADRAGTRVAPILLDGGEHGLLATGPLGPPDGVRAPHGARDVALAGIFAYRALLAAAVSERGRTQLPYRVLDASGALLARGPTEYPDDAGPVRERQLSIPDGETWTIDVAVGPFEPRLARAALWTGGLLLLAAVAAALGWEERHAARVALHLQDLEKLSRHLVDANVRLEERAEQVAAANRAKSRFLANVSHELRTPLNAVMGYNALALEELYGPLLPGLRAAHERIRAAGEHLLALVDDVLDLSKLETGSVEVAPERVDVAVVVDAVARVVEPIAEAKGVRLDVLYPCALPRVRTDPRRLRQILLQLAGNAVKFTEHGSVLISARVDPDGPDALLRVRVEDTGIGIAPADQERIFEEFEQVNPGGRGDSLRRGTGLGLAVSRRLARALGGDITLESRVAEGSCFTLLLPSAVPHDDPPTARRDEARPSAAERADGLDAAPSTG